LASKETVTTPTKVSLAEQMEYELNLGQRSSQYIREGSIHLGNALVFKSEYLITRMFMIIAVVIRVKVTLSLSKIPLSLLVQNN